VISAFFKKSAVFLNGYIESLLSIAAPITERPSIISPLEKIVVWSIGGLVSWAGKTGIRAIKKAISEEINLSIMYNPV
jgi:hypothetical protein